MMTTHAARSRALAVLEMLCERYPATFVSLSQTPRLLAVGLREAVQAENPDIAAADLRRAFGLYCVRAAYRSATVPNADRIDLRGDVVAIVDAGEIQRMKEARRCTKAVPNAKEAERAEQLNLQAEPIPQPAIEAEPLVEPQRSKLSLPQRREARRPVVVQVIKRRHIAGPMR